MSMFDCIQRAMDDTGEDGVKADRARGERAQAMWREMADAYERQGHPRQTAEQLAAEDLREQPSSSSVLAGAAVRGPRASWRRWRGGVPGGVPWCRVQYGAPAWR